MAVELYGIPNCDTVKKARLWLDTAGIDYTFHDYKKEGAYPDLLGQWADAVGWEELLNRRGTTFRKLDEADKAGIDRSKAIALMVQHPSMIKRPVVVCESGVLVGFDPEKWASALT